MAGNQERFDQAMNLGHSAAWDLEWDRAAGFYRLALEEYSDHPKALSSLALALFETSEYEQALHYYRKAARVAPDDPTPLEKVAMIHEFQGQVELACQEYFRAADLHAKNRDYKKALETWTGVLRLNPEHLPARSRIAVVHERLGNKQQAVTEYLAVASLLQHSGDVQKAAEAASHALQLQPGNSHVQQVISALKEGQALPKPVRPRGATGPLDMHPGGAGEGLSQPGAAALDPVAEARQRAISDLADLLFEQPGEEIEEQDSGRSLKTIVQGNIPASSSKHVDMKKYTFHLTQAVDLQSQGKDGEAIGFLVRSIEAGLEHPAAFFNLGLLLAEAGQFEETTRYLQNAVRHEPYQLAARLLLGKARQQQGQLKEAAIEFLEALKIADVRVVSQNDAEELSQLYGPVIDAHLHNPDQDSHQRICENVQELLNRPDWQAHLALTRQQLPSQQPGYPPLPLAEMLTETRGSQVIESIENIRQLAEAGHFRAAMEEAHYALSKAPTYLPLHSYIAELLFKQNRVSQAVEKFRMVARSYNVRGEIRRAIDMYRRVIDLSPIDTTARMEFIELLLTSRMVEQVLQQYLDLAQRAYDQADLHTALDMYRRALQLAQKEKREPAWQARILHKIADINLQSLDWRQAVLVFEELRNLQPDDELARAGIININFRLGQKNQALDELDRFVSSLWKSGQRDKATRFLEGIVEENEGQVKPRRLLAQLYKVTGKPGQAIEQLEKVREIFIKAGDQSMAAETVKAILALDPPDAGEYLKLLSEQEEQHTNS